MERSLSNVQHIDPGRAQRERNRSLLVRKTFGQLAERWYRFTTPQKYAFLLNCALFLAFLFCALASTVPRSWVGGVLKEINSGREQTTIKLSLWHYCWRTEDAVTQDVTRGCSQLKQREVITAGLLAARGFAIGATGASLIALISTYIYIVHVDRIAASVSFFLCVAAGVASLVAVCAYASAATTRGHLKADEWSYQWGFVFMILAGLIQLAVGVGLKLVSADATKNVLASRGW